MDTVEAIRVQAMLDVMDGDFFYHYRAICRWFSKTYHTPLPQVEELEVEYVLKHFFESQYEQATKAERKKIAAELVENEAERSAREKAEQAKTDDAFAKRIAKKAKEDEAKALKKLKASAAKVAKELREAANQELVKPPPAKAKPPPDISMSFGDSGNLSEEESIPVPPPRKR